MSLINQLTSFLKENLPAEIFRGQKITSFTDGMELKRLFKAMSDKQMQGGIVTYDAVLSFDEWPYRKLDPKLLFMLVNVWIEQLPDVHNYEVTEDPTLDVDVIDEQTADITVSVKVTENLYMIEDEKGAIPFNGKRYRIDNPVFWYNPENIEVIPKDAD